MAPCQQSDRCYFCAFFGVLVIWCFDGGFVRCLSFLALNRFFEVALSQAQVLGSDFQHLIFADESE